MTRPLYRVRAYRMARWLLAGVLNVIGRRLDRIGGVHSLHPEDLWW